MRRVNIFLLIIFSAFIFTGCVSIPNPFKSNTFVVKEGYLSLSEINKNVAKQMPIEQSAGKDKVKIINTSVFAGSNRKTLAVEAEFIYTSFEIPEGLPAVAHFKASLKYEPKTKEFKLDNVVLTGVKFLKEQLLEYVSPSQKKFVIDTLVLKMDELILHKSKKQLKTIKSFIVKDGKIHIEFN